MCVCVCVHCGHIYTNERFYLRIFWSSVVPLTCSNLIRGGTRAAAISKMERFVITVNG